MGAAIASSLPYSLAAAASPLAIAGVTLLLLSGRGGVRSLSLAGGRLLGYAAVLICVIVASDLVGSVSETGRALVGAVARLVLGALTLGTGLWTWLRRRRSSVWKRIRVLDQMTPTTSAGFGLTLSVGPTTLLLVAAAGLAIAGNGITPLDEAVAAVVFLAIANSTVLLPIVLYYAAGSGVASILEPIEVWLEANALVITVAALGLVGIFLVISGILGLL